ncbi:protein ESMERALDA 1 isoform X2 [Cryptomeria japonica]|uniref:protein ESMERALDA 1 isoform X2 n=1 Tax=Cryptomeria japonica TaxID=3369 RepID=UPI0025AD01BA|nr:protein ESMERALDA 1 isoform X2 [Cryptomeria japonica]
MHAYNRLSSSAHSSPSPPSSPRRSSPRLRHGRNKSGRMQGSIGPPLPPRTFMQKFAWLLLSVLLKRHGLFLFAPLIYISGMLLYMGTVSFDAGEVVRHHLAPGSVYRSPQVFENLWPAMQIDNETHNTLIAAWQHPRDGEKWRPCIKETENNGGLPASNGYLFVEANGGLNQQRVSICNAVAVAYLLNATLVIPNFHFNSIWKDPRKLPEAVMEKFDNNMSNIFNFKAKAWSPVNYYEEKVLPKLLEDGVIRISPFANRLSQEVPPSIQRMRCLANYEALRFVDPIGALADQLVQRMIQHSSTSNGKYIAVHLRFEEDMVAFSCCVYDGGKEEKEELDVAREKGWRGKFNRTGRVIRPGQIRMNGKCPLTPLEVGMMLRGMGFDNNTSIYLAAGKIYKAEKNMLPLKQMFPLLQTKESLATADELTPFKNYSSRMAALDYSVCLHSEVFVTTQGGNFPHFLMGHRRYLYGGHSKTIKPDKRKLALLLDNPKISWKTFKQQMQAMRHHSDVKGIEIRKVNASVYTFPAPDCMCRERHMETLEA